MTTKLSRGNYKAEHIRKRHQISFTLDDGHMEQLSKLVLDTGMSRAHVVRQIVEEALNEYFPVAKYTRFN